MIYHQVALTRLSRAGKLLEADGVWHPGAAPRSLYRVAGRIVQQLRLEDGEHAELAALFESIRPFPTLLLREGFREGLRFSVTPDGYLLRGIHLPAAGAGDALRRAALDLGLRIAADEGNLLSFAVPFDEWSDAALREALLLARVFPVVGGDAALRGGQGAAAAREISSAVLSAVQALRGEMEVSDPPARAPGRPRR
jgi:hypothetical protein